ncbi:hypothetical protein ACHAP5_012156 [Fusarium lateritium]
MTKHSRPRRRAAHMHPYRRNERQGPNNRRNTADQDAGAQEQAGDARGDAPNADPPQGPASDDDQQLPVPLRPQPHLFGQLRVLPSVAISLRPRFVVANPRETGPQTDICARVPGRFNTWVARLSCEDTFFDFGDLVTSHGGVAPTSIYSLWKYSEHTYTLHRYENMMVSTAGPDVNIVFWANESSTGDDDPDEEAPGLEGHEIIPAILGEEGMRMVV